MGTVTGQLLSLTPYHLASIGMVIILSAAAAFVSLPIHRVERFNLNFKDDSLPAPVVALLNGMRIQILLTLPKEVPMDVEDTLLRGIIGRKFPLTIQGSGGKLAFVVDFNSQPKMGMVQIYGKDLNRLDGDITAHPGLQLLATSREKA